MPVTSDCSSCGSKLKVPDDLLGREVRCPRCGTITVVKDPAVPPALERDPEYNRTRSSAPATPGRSHPAPPEEHGLKSGSSRPVGYREAEDRPDDDVQYRRRVKTAAGAQSNGAALGLGIASLVLGVIAVPFALVPCIGVWSLPVSGLGLLLGAIGIVLVVVSKKGGMGLPIAGTSVSFVALAIAGVWFLICAGMMSGMKKGFEDLGKQLEEQQQREAASWLDASKDAATHGDVRVRVASVTLGRVEVDEDNRGIGKPAADYLMIRLSIEKTSPVAAISYKGWSGKGAFDPDAATLKDNVMSTYPAAMLLAKVEGRVRNQQPIKPGQSLEDLLVFEPLRNNPEELRLELPCSAVGGVGRIKFRILASIIKRQP
jgi:hypothetical protein